ncbi:MAG: hypothetical protein BWY89_01850 [Bacteroidetes bacterium ADurb.BinA012]|nr:MAG: hypothetical protein BWY89_01850 [Bacteroidetes bacterium ADurb.BinA012]
MTISNCMVEQLGLAMIRVAEVIAAAFISGITRGIPFSILQAEELSITVAPFSAKTGAHSFETDAPAENSTTSGADSTASITLTTFTGLPLNITSLPTERSDAAGKSLSTGNCLSSRTFSIILPTIPVTPTTATFISFVFKKNVLTL